MKYKYGHIFGVAKVATKRKLFEKQGNKPELTRDKNKYNYLLKLHLVDDVEE